MGRLASVPDLEQELDRLYGVAPDRFVAERDALAARLRQAHQGDAASTVAKLKKPVAVAWAANRLAREEPRAVDKLLAASTRLRDAQKRALSGRGGRGEVGDAQAAEHEAVRELVESARTKLDPPVSGTALDRLGQTLRAAAASPPTRELLEHGRLTGEVQVTGFEALEGMNSGHPRRRKTDEVAQAARARLKSLREESRRLAAAARSADRAAATAERTASTLRAEADAGRAAAERAADAVAQAEAALKRRNS
jgi:hypothetical protein